MIWGFLIGNFNIKCPFSSGCQFFTYLQFDISYVSIRFKIGNGAFYFIFYFDIPCLNSFLNMTFGLLVYFSNLIYNNGTPQSGSNNKPPLPSIVLSRCQCKSPIALSPTPPLPTTTLSRHQRLRYPVDTSNAIPPTTLSLPRHRQQHYPVIPSNAISPPMIALSQCCRQRYSNNYIDATHHGQQQQHYPIDTSNALLPTTIALSNHQEQYCPVNATHADPSPW